MCGFNIFSSSSSCYNCNKPKPENEPQFQKGVAAASTNTSTPLLTTQYVDQDKPGSVPLRLKLEHHRNKNLQIERNNRSIFLRRLRDKWRFDIYDLTHDTRGIAKKVFQNAIGDKKVVCILKESSSSESAEKSKKKIKLLYRNITQIERETGLQETYFGYLTR